MLSKNLYGDKSNLLVNDVAFIYELPYIFHAYINKYKYKIFVCYIHTYLDMIYIIIYTIYISYKLQYETAIVQIELVQSKIFSLATMTNEHIKKVINLLY